MHGACWCAQVAILTTHLWRTCLVFGDARHAVLRLSLMDWCKIDVTVKCWNKSAMLLQQPDYRTTINMCLQELISLTEEQTLDLIYIRRLYRTKRKDLETQRKTIIRQLAEVELQDAHPSESFLSLSGLISSVQQITEQDWATYYTVLRGAYRGVRHRHLAYLMQTNASCRHLLMLSTNITRNLVSKDPLHFKLAPCTHMHMMQEG